MALIKRGNIWYLRTMIGGRRRFLSTGQKDRKRAERRAAQLTLQLQDQKLGWAPTSLTVAEWLDRYQRTYTRLKGASGRIADARVMRVARPLWGERQLSSISTQDCAALLAKREAEGMAPNTRRFEHGLLGAIFGKAEQEGLIARNPWRGLKRGMPQARTRVLSLEEQARLLIAIPARYRDLMLALLGTGLRHQEMAKLKSGDIRPDGLHVIGKRGRARVVPVQAETRERLEGMVPLPEGKIRNLWASLRAATKKLKLPTVTIHDLRRTFATRCATAGMPMVTLAKILGHTNIQVTAQYYTHIAQQDAQAALERVNLGVGERGKVIPIGKGR